LVLKRTDREDTGDAISGVDWGGEVPLTWAYAAVLSAIRERRLSKLHAFDTLTEMRVKRGFAMLSRGRAVATDRLHGHIMSVLLGIPHFVSDNSTGKLTAFGEAWTFAAGFAHRREKLSTITRAEAQAIAQ
ncbi:MAG: polysaccharide pyruvyl transferase family protein, partial [Pseudomonadota bacterium]